MATCQITCITLSVANGSYEHIVEVGNPAAGWFWTVEQVIESIEAKTNVFYVEDPWSGKRAYVGVVRQQGRRPHIRTYADGVWTDNLLSLNACPWRAAA